jgi:hypothetical protein
VGVRLDRERELEVARDDAADGTRQPKRLGLVERLAIEGEAGDKSHPLVGPA